MYSGAAGSEGDEGAASLPQPAPRATDPASATTAPIFDTGIPIRLAAPSTPARSASFDNPGQRRTERTSGRQRDPGSHSDAR